MEIPMSEPAELREAAALAAGQPPKSFSSFALAALPPKPQPGMALLPWVDFSVSCKACGCDDFRVGSFVENVPDPSSYPNAAPGEQILQPPHRLKCERCGAVGTIFDARTDGYDGILNGGCSYASGESGEQFSDLVCKVVVVATYNIDLTELQELATQAGSAVKATDLFDWINIIATAPDGERLELDYECA
jgi:hypothetical protein